MDESQVPIGEVRLSVLCPIRGPHSKPCAWSSGSERTAALSGHLRMTGGINEEELIGAVTIQGDLLKRDMLNNWSDETG